MIDSLLKIQNDVLKKTDWFINWWMLIDSLFFFSLKFNLQNRDLLTHLWSKCEDFAYADSNVGTFAAFLGLELRMPSDLPIGDIQKL